MIERAARRRRASEVPVGTPLAIDRRGRAGAGHGRRRRAAPAAPGAGTAPPRAAPAPPAARPAAAAAPRDASARSSPAWRRSHARRAARRPARARPATGPRGHRRATSSAPRPRAGDAPHRTPPPSRRRRAAGRHARPRCGSAIAALMARSKREIPHYYLAHHHRPAARARRGSSAHNARAAGRPSGCCRPRCCSRRPRSRPREVPELNGFWIDDGVPAERRASTSASPSSLRGGGLVAPAIHDADQLDARRADGARCATSSRAPARGRLRSSEMSDADDHRHQPRRPGRRDACYGVIYPPQVALVGFGRDRRAAVGRRRACSARARRHARRSPPTTAPATATAARRFLAAIDRLLQDPEEL